jgi:hypothetical protein
MSASSNHLARHAVAKVVHDATAPKKAQSKKERSQKANFKKEKLVANAAAFPRLDWPNVVIESLGECCTEFLHLVVAEANELSRNEHLTKSKSKSKRKRNQSTASALQHSVSPVHLYASLRTLGFDAFVSDAIRACAHSERDTSRQRDRKKQRHKPISAEEAQALQAEQERLFAQAALLFDKQGGAAAAAAAAET